MADKKITDLTGYTPPVDTDVIPIVDVTSGSTKKITWANIKVALNILYARLGSNNVFTGTNTMTGRLIIPMAELSYFSVTGTAVVIAAQSDGATNMVVVRPTTILNNDSGFDNGGDDDGRLRYTGAVTKMFHVACTVSFSGAGANNTLVIAVAKNGTVVVPSKIIRKMQSSGDIGSSAMHVMLALEQDDYLEIYVGNMSGTDDIVVNSISLFAMGM